MKVYETRFKGLPVRYLHWPGEGPVVWFLHGYGEQASSFQALANALTGSFSIFALDLPLHGESRWTGREHFKPADLWALMEQIEGERSVVPGPRVLVGYSMGARLALMLPFFLKENLHHLVLLAPDGLRPNLWRYVATRTWLGSWLFRRWMRRPGPLLSFLSWSRRRGWINTSLDKFVRDYLQDPGGREELFLRWTFFRNFEPNARKVQKILRDKGVKVDLVFGRFDRIIPEKRGEPWARALGNFCKIHQVEAGHGLLQERTAAALASILRST